MWSGMLSIPNFITLARLCVLPLFLYLLFAKDERAGAALLLGVLGMTDWVDGWFARKFNQVSAFGSVFDPTVDRVLFVVSAIGVLIDGAGSTHVTADLALVVGWLCAIPGLALSYYTAVTYVPIVRSNLQKGRAAKGLR